MGGTLDNGVGHCFLHEIDLTLADKFHVSVRQRDLKLLRIILSEPPKGFRLVCPRCARALLHGRKDQEWVALAAEVEVLAKW